jgi:hypothetical protein
MKKVAIEDIEPLAPPDENIPDGAMANSVGEARPLYYRRKTSQSHSRPVFCKPVTSSSG